MSNEVNPREMRNDIITREESPNAIAMQSRQVLFDDIFAGDGGGAIHNFPGTAIEQYRMIALCSGPDVSRGAELNGKEISIKYWYAHRVDMVDPKTGEMNNGIRVVLVNDKNEAVGFVSDGIRKDLALIIQTFGMGPYVPPVRVTLREVQTRLGYRVYKLVPVA